MQQTAKFLSKHGAIITGSFALSALGFFGENSERTVHDIDLVFQSLDQFRQFEKDCKELVVEEKIVLDYADDYYRGSLQDCAIKIDCFIRNNDIATITFDGITYESPRSIVKAKIDILFDRFMNIDDDTYKKHQNDLHYIFELSKGFIDKTIGTQVKYV